MMAGNERGLAGCGCLVVIVVVVIIAAGLTMHPFTLRLLGSRFYYTDKVSPGDIILVPRFSEDKNGELYVDAFREYWAGNGKTLWIEDEKILGTSLREFVARMAKERGIKEEAVKKIEAEGEGLAREQSVMTKIAALKVKGVVVIVPEYASRRFRLLYDSSKVSQHTTFMIKGVHVSYFKKDKWWKDEQSRHLLVGEIYDIASLYVNRFKHGDKDEVKKE
jgi:hypothetical protein